MFTIDPTLRHLSAAPELLVSIDQSINQPHVAVPQREAQAASGFIVSLGGDGAVDLFIYLWLSRAREAVIYRHDGSLERGAALEAARLQALEFCESMGFMMERLPIASLELEERRALLSELPPFQLEPAPRQLEGRASLQDRPSGPSMNAHYDGTPGPVNLPAEALEPIVDDAPALTSAEVERFARLLVRF